jgi:hypothetical protein
MGYGEHEQPQIIISKRKRHVKEDPYENTNIKLPTRIVMRKWPMSRSFPAGSPTARSKKICVEPIQLMADAEAVLDRVYKS